MRKARERLLRVDGGPSFIVWKSAAAGGLRTLAPGFCAAYVIVPPAPGVCASEFSIESLIACLAVFIVVLGDQGNQSSAYSSNPEFFNSIQGFSHGIEVKTGKGLI